jgi:hypothetical protein
MSGSTEISLSSIFGWLEGAPSGIRTNVGGKSSSSSEARAAQSTGCDHQHRENNSFTLFISFVTIHK